MGSGRNAWTQRTTGQPSDVSACRRHDCSAAAAITGTLGVNTATRDAIIAEYPLSNYANPSFAASARLSVAYSAGISAGPDTGRDSTPRWTLPDSSRAQFATVCRTSSARGGLAGGPGRTLRQVPCRS